jgi:hypothetical protein
MKIISHGHPPAPPRPPWPLGQEFVCPACGCIFELEPRDGPIPINDGVQYILSPDRGPTGAREMTCFCPECREWTSYERPPALPNAANLRLLVNLRRGS